MEVKPGYKQTEVGVIPKDWETKPCSRLSSLITVGIVVRPTQYYCEQGVPALRSANIREDGINEFDMVYISEESNRLLAKSQVKTGDVLTVRTGYPGTSATVPPHLAGSNCIDILITRPSDKVCSGYLVSWINSPFGKSQVLRDQGGLAQQHFNVGDLRDLVIAMPPTKAEQEAIAEALSDADTLIESLEQLIAKKRHLKQGAMQELLTGKRRLPGFENTLGYQGAEMGAVPRDWEIQHVQHLVRQGPKNGYSGKIGECSRGTPTLSLAATSSGRMRLDSDSVKHLADTVPMDSPLFLEFGDVLVQRSNTLAIVGTTAVYFGPSRTFVYPDLMMRLRFRIQVTAEWFWRYANSTRGRRYFESVAAGSTGSMPKVSGGALRNMPVPVPSIAEQTAIASVLSDMDTEIDGLESRLAKARQMKQGMMQELLTGRIRLV